VAAFERAFARRPEGVAEAPGRVNLIGEHVDYNDGLVLPFAIDRSVIVAWAARNDATIRASAIDAGAEAQFDVRAVGPAGHADWSSYVRAVVHVLDRAGHAPHGVDLAITGDVPQGAGLSSSAALEVAVMGALRDAFALSIDDVRLARLCQRAENEFVGVKSGVMDQFAATLSRRGHALLVDCRSLDHRHIPLRLAAAGLALAIVHSGVPRELAGSAYNERRRECDAAVDELRSLLRRRELTSLRDVSPGDLVALPATPSAPLRRARHVVTEIARVNDAVVALGRDDYAAFGALMRASHVSLRDDYEVSSRELDMLVELASAQPYVLGARLTGAGFGGCTVHLLRADALKGFERDVVEVYRERTALPAVIYVTSPQDGLRTWRL
jgi:galactokinase